MARYGAARQQAHSAAVIRLIQYGEPWSMLPRDQRLGDILETIEDREPRKSDPFPGPMRALVRDLGRQGLPLEVIDSTVRDLLERGRLGRDPRFRISDRPLSDKTLPGFAGGGPPGF